MAVVNDDDAAVALPAGWSDSEGIDASPGRAVGDTAGRAVGDAAGHAGGGTADRAGGGTAGDGSDCGSS